MTRAGSIDCIPGTGQAGRRVLGRAPDTGSSTLELTIVAAAFLLLVSTAIAGGRIAIAGQAVEAAAFEAARTASLARSASAAQSQATATATRIIHEQGLQCADVGVRLDTSGFAKPVGRPARVGAAVQCRVPLADLAIPGLPGSRLLEAEATSPLDTYRGRES
ncbi:MAG: pilus assembly protein [Actinomycetia bacterium]|nr:pilus assembly protein [Actinomycetes bacterium]